MIEERYELAIARIQSIKCENTVREPYREYFVKMAEFAEMIHKLREELIGGVYQRADAEHLKAWNHMLYQDILPENYETSYANPDYAAAELGEVYGKMLGFLYAELRGAIPYVYEGKTEYLDILFELLIEIYNLFEGEEPEPDTIKDVLYWYASDYCDVFVADRIREQICPEESFAADMIMNSDLRDEKYLYQFGEYIGENELGTARYLATLPEETIQKMADVYTEGYRMGFVNTGKDLSKKSVVNIRYTLGFELVIKKAIENFEKMGLRPVIYRAAVSALTKRQHRKIGYYGAIANKQYEYDHKDDQSIFLDKKFVERKLEVIQTTYEHYKEEAARFAGPACMETFGEKPFEPVPKETACKLSEKQEELSLNYDSRQSQLTNAYIPGDERSFTIIAYPVPEIGSQYEEIFEEIIRINTLDAATYEKVQQTLIDALDQGEYVHILGGNGNRTDLKVQLCRLQDPQKETIFENCVADVNIPVGEVFTTPRLKDTTGLLHVSEVFLNGLCYKDLRITFEDGKVTDYSCGNFDDLEEGRRYIRENILFGRDTLPIGEFAIGTNTTAYVMAAKYGIMPRLPILIAEKMGPHIALGDTCYSYSEDVRVYNPDGKEIIAKDNECSLLRKKDRKKAYFNCHTDITIPYEALDRIVAVSSDRVETPIILDGRFVLEGTLVLNEAFQNGK